MKRTIGSKIPLLLGYSSVFTAVMYLACEDDSRHARQEQATQARAGDKPATVVFSDPIVITPERNVPPEMGAAYAFLRTQDRELDVWRFMDDHQIKVSVVTDLPFNIAGTFSENDGAKISATNEPLEMASTIAHEAWHGFQHEYYGYTRTVENSAYSPRQQFGVWRFVEASACAFGAYAMASNARHNAPLRRLLLDREHEDKELGIAAGLYRGAGGSFAPPTQEGLRGHYLSHAFRPCMKRVQDSAYYHGAHLALARYKAGKGTLATVPDAEVDAWMQDGLYPSLDRESQAANRLTGSGKVTLGNILSTESDTVRRELSGLEAQYNASSARLLRELAPLHMPCDNCNSMRPIIIPKEKPAP